jgi:hypothetical protein
MTAIRDAETAAERTHLMLSLIVILSIAGLMHRAWDNKARPVMRA